ncbi:glycoside hydrolase family 15 protein [Bradyrhizobium sp. BTAi1]|uniref:glycoside hydrolase family 15 protein n=1 Tax=Bradyrhizobium sp. (strain BTAi1 / ATCC BAA-1182) TaxID=288000 RepID=UPI0005A2BDB8
MIRRALGYIARVGPSTDQDRWEENSGLNTFTLATCIAAPVAGGALLEPMARHWATAGEQSGQKNRIRRFAELDSAPIGFAAQPLVFCCQCPSTFCVAIR